MFHVVKTLVLCAVLIALHNAHMHASTLGRQIVTLANVEADVVKHWFVHWREQLIGGN